MLTSRWGVLSAALALCLPATAQDQWRYEGGPGLITRGVCYDEHRGEVIALGTDATWVHDGNRWQRHASPLALVGRRGPVMAFDEATNTVVLVGGRAPANGVGDTWSWDGASWTLLLNDPQLASAEDLMVFDAGRGRLVRHGYRGGNARYLMEWDGSTWVSLGYSLGSLEGMAYDRVAGRLIGLRNQRLYEWQNGAWVVFTGYVAPSAPYSATRLVYDRSSNDLMAFLGDAYEVGVYRWDGTTFTLQTSSTYPPGRDDFTPVWNSRRGGFFLQGGYSSWNTRHYLDTWEWRGGQWTQWQAPPPPRISLGAIATWATYDPVRDRVVFLQAPADGDPGVREWDGRRWTRGPVPNLTGRGPLVYDSQRQRCVLLAWGSGATVQTWTYDGVSWTQLSPATSPPNRVGFDCAYDAARDRIVLYGGTAGAPGNETWLFDGTDWQQATPATSPPASWHHRLAYDPVRQNVVMFTSLGTTWIWDGSTWTPKTGYGPGPRIAFAMAWDPAHQVIALTGGANPNYTPGWPIALGAQHWEWNGSAWSFRSGTGVPMSVSAVMTSTEDSLVLFGGGQKETTGALLRFVTAPRAAVSAYGVGCPGSHGVPVLDAAFVPYLGHLEFGLQLTAVPAGALCGMAFGFGSAAVPLGGGCSQLVAGPIAVQVTVADAGGGADFPVGVPNAPGLLGVDIWAQGAALDPAGAFNGVALSGGMVVSVGN